MGRADIYQIWSNWKNWNVKLMCRMWSTHTCILKNSSENLKKMVLFVWNHPNVDCVHGHLEREIIQCVKRWPFINIHSSPMYRNVVNVLSRLVGSCQKEKPFYSTVMLRVEEIWPVSHGDLYHPKPFQIACVDHLEFSYLSPTVSTWKRPPAVKYPKASGEHFNRNYSCAFEDVNQVKCQTFSHLADH